MKDMMVRQPRANLNRLQRIGGLRFLYNRQIYHRGKFYDDEVEEPSREFISNLPIVLETLKRREGLVLTLRYLEEQPKSLAQIAQIVGVTSERIRQIEARALRKLMHPDKKQALGLNTNRKSRCQA